MSITYAPVYTLAHPPRRRPPGAVPELARLGVVAALLAVLVAAGGAVHLLNGRSAARLDVVMTAAAQALLPGGRVEAVEVVDGPALLAVHRPHVQETRATGRTRQGFPVRLRIRDYDRVTGVAQAVSWQVSGLPLAPEWRVVDGASPDLSQVEREIDGHRVQMTATASVQGDQVLVAPGRLTVDGVPATLAEAQPAVRIAVEPMLLHVQRMPVPVPGATVSVRYVWFGGDGMGVELRADGVPTATEGR